MKDIDHIMHVLEHHPESRAGLLVKVADRARRELADIPTIETWDLNCAEGPNSVAGLLHAIKQSDHRRKGRKDRWFAAAELLHWCLRAIPRAESLRQRDLLAIQRLATKADSASGSATVSGGGQGGRKSKLRKWAVMAAEHATCWQDFPDPESPLEFEDWIVYRDGDRLVAVDQYNDRETSLARSTVEKRYLK